VSVTDVGAAACVTERGQVLWRADVCRPVHHRPAVIGGSLWVACDDGEWTALDVKTGQARWRQTGRRVPADAVASDGVRGFIASADGAIEAVDETGRSLWTSHGGTAPFAAGDLVIASGAHGLVALEAATGERRWADARPVVALATDDARVFAARAAGDLVAWDSEGHPLWGVTLGAFAPGALSFAGDALTVGLASGDVVEVGASDGAEHSRKRLPAPLAAPVHAGVAVLQGREGCAVVLATAQTACANHQLRGAAIVRDSVLLLGPRDGRVLGFQLKLSARAR
jgi:outer membrane protein assembly factor BamB